MNRLRRLLDRARNGAAGDAGVTLAELTVTTTIMAVVMAIFTTGIVQLFRASNKNELVATTQSQLNTAFLRLDRELRYAAGIGPPHDSGSDHFVEYVNTDTGTPECAQLQLNAAAGTLRRQVWPQTTQPAGKWTVLASNVVVAQSGFVLEPLTETTAFQRLHLTLVVASNPGSGQTSATTDLTFTALNSTRATESAKVCPEARSGP